MNDLPHLDLSGGRKEEKKNSGSLESGYASRGKSHTASIVMPLKVVAPTKKRSEGSGRRGPLHRLQRLRCCGRRSEAKPWKVFAGVLFSLGKLGFVRLCPTGKG